MLGHRRLLDILSLLFHLIWPRMVGGLEKEAVVVKEDSDAVLPCSSSNRINLEKILILWKKDDEKNVFLYDSGLHYNNAFTGQDPQFKGRVTHYPDKLKNGNASIKIQNTKRADSGVYTCFIPNLQPQELYPVKLVVEMNLKDRSGEIPGAWRRPYVTISNVSAEGAWLQCEVEGVSPTPVLEWRDDDGNVLPAVQTSVAERKGLYDVFIGTVVTKASRVWCVVTQEEISHQAAAEIFVPLSAPPHPDTSPGVHWTALIGLMVVQFVASVLVVVLLQRLKFIRIILEKSWCQWSPDPPPPSPLKLEDLFTMNDVKPRSALTCLMVRPEPDCSTRKCEMGLSVPLDHH